MQDITCYGFKSEFTFKAKRYEKFVDKILFESGLCMEIGKSEAETSFSCLFIVKWKEQKLSEKIIYNVGAELLLNDLEQRT